jgi:hypothetical protein
MYLRKKLAQAAVFSSLILKIMNPNVGRETGFTATGFRGVRQPLQKNSNRVFSIRIKPLPSMSFASHCALSTFNYKLHSLY